MKCLLLIPALFGLVINPGQAIAADGNQVLAQCTDLLELVDGTSSTPDSSRKGYNAGYCTGLVQGITQASALYESSGRLTAPVTCLPKSGVQNGQAARVLVKYLKEHPADMHLDAAVLAMLALRDAFPCPRAPEGGR